MLISSLNLHSLFVHVQFGFKNKNYFKGYVKDVFTAGTFKIRNTDMTQNMAVWSLYARPQSQARTFFVETHLGPLVTFEHFSYPRPFLIKLAN